MTVCPGQVPAPSPPLGGSQRSGSRGRTLRGGLVLWAWMAKASLLPSSQPRKLEACVSELPITSTLYLVSCERSPCLEPQSWGVSCVAPPGTGPPLKASWFDTFIIREIDQFSRRTHILLFKALVVENNNYNDKSFLFSYAEGPSCEAIWCSERLQALEMVAGNSLCPSYVTTSTLPNLSEPQFPLRVV